ncbi:hypothetical protein PF004_g11432 [Phytophthora fragariae]|uniref:Uncharacterized protein n=1 Tax=Phytophthora fragariae TaxID=53985 RepID=A0A6G0NYC6_9STRA|nr:hypothetical protein PF004_g11432 [Phytophthora fragariae]
MKLRISCACFAAAASARASRSISYCCPKYNVCNGARIGQCPFRGKGMFSGVDYTGRCGPQELSVTHHDWYWVPGSLNRVFTVDLPKYYVKLGVGRT